LSFSQRYSRYLPVVQAEQKSVRKNSVSKDTEIKPKKEGAVEPEREVSRASADLLPSKRRSTMNSRQTYDEEEMLRKAIEESRGEKDEVGSSRKGKRNRDESEEYVKRSPQKVSLAHTPFRNQQETKRQRKNSESNGTGSTQNAASIDPDAESDEDAPSSSRSALKKARAHAAEIQREKDRREQEKSRVHQRAEAAKGRQARAGRRRADGKPWACPLSLSAILMPTESEPAENTPKLEPTPLPPASSQQPSPPTIELDPPSSSHKKGGKKAKRQGRNQYTKEKDAMSPSRKANTSNSSGEESKTKSSEATAAVATTAAPTKTSPNGSGQEAPSAPVVKGKGRWKGKGRNAAAASDSDSKKDKSELTIKDMDRATQLMLDFIEKNVPQQQIVTGHSMLRNASTAGMYGLPPRTTPAAPVPEKPDEQLSSADLAEKLRLGIATFRTKFVTPTPGGLTV